MSDDEAQNLTDLYTIEYFSAKAGGEKGECKDYIKIKYDPKFKDELKDPEIGDERIWEIDNFIKMMNKGNNFEQLWKIGRPTLEDFGKGESVVDDGDDNNGIKTKIKEKYKKYEKYLSNSESNTKKEKIKDLIENYRTGLEDIEFNRLEMITNSYFDKNEYDVLHMRVINDIIYDIAVNVKKDKIDNPESKKSTSTSAQVFIGNDIKSLLNFMYIENNKGEGKLLNLQLRTTPNCENKEILKKLFKSNKNCSQEDSVETFSKIFDLSRNKIYGLPDLSDNPSNPIPFNNTTSEDISKNINSFLNEDKSFYKDISLNEGDAFIISIADYRKQNFTIPKSFTITKNNVSTKIHLLSSFNYSGTGLHGHCTCNVMDGSENNFHISDNTLTKMGYKDKPNDVQALLYVNKKSDKEFNTFKREEKVISPIANNGNTCFFNTAVQVLVHLKAYFDWDKEKNNS